MFNIQFNIRFMQITCKYKQLTIKNQAFDEKINRK